MIHYVLIDNFSGFVWGGADAADPVAACAILDKEVGGEPRKYEITRISNTTESGYLVFEAPADWLPVDDGQSQDEIKRTLALHKVAEVKTRMISD